VLDMPPPGHFIGCALENMSQFRKWFTSSETRRLHMLGYRLVKMSVDVVLAASENQLVFSRRRPFQIGVTQLAWPVDAGDAKLSSTLDTEDAHRMHNNTDRTTR